MIARVGAVVFPGSNGEQEVVHAVGYLVGEAGCVRLMSVPERRRASAMSFGHSTDLGGLDA